MENNSKNHNRKWELLDLIPLLLSLLTPIIIIIMINKGIEVEFTSGNITIIPYTDLFPAWSLVFFFGGWYATLIITNWMLLEYKQKLFLPMNQKTYKSTPVIENSKMLETKHQTTLDKYTTYFIILGEDGSASHSLPTSSVNLKSNCYFFKK